jgi:hypothetical protein
MEKIIDRIKKLLELANNNPNEHEAQAAMAKATEMLEAYNLDMAVLGTSGKGAQRSDTKKNGGLYGWQRKLWKAVAEMNFCHYLSVKGLAKGSTYEHRLIGSHANVVSTEMMAAYLQETVEKLAQQWAKSEGFKSVFVRDAIAYREGMAYRITERLQARRDQLVREEQQRTEERKREEAARGQASTSSALTLVDIISTEADFNNDYLNGWELGTTARNRHERDMAAKANEARHAENRRVHEEKMLTDPAYRAMKEAEAVVNAAYWAEWDKKHAAKAARRSSYVSKGPRARAQTEEEKRQGLAAFWEGHDAGKNVGIDTQVDKSANKELK